MPSRRTNNFPESGRGLGHATPTIFGSTVSCPSDSLASCTAVLAEYACPVAEPSVWNSLPDVLHDPDIDIHSGQLRQRTEANAIEPLTCWSTLEILSHLCFLNNTFLCQTV